ncbi:membrane protein insertase YidC [Desulfobotulus sp. H1]|uniref:Membrane protein insertase YidC n=1 Tax=Desulfobotulus pelophilus TaxID=2823377 RepID=A0ABT3NCW5_9BACT|nr:membrane protein insertase YidC [Desulfobotulus pelophilus]MCW7754802.1 membrane protein insertase YidC [Desulfobotulus pelophilus]
MEQFRFLAAIVLSFLVFIVWNYFFMPEPSSLPEEPREVAFSPLTERSESASPDLLTFPQTDFGVLQSAPQRAARLYTVETPLYTAVITEKGAAFEGFSLKHYRESSEKGSPEKQILESYLGPNFTLSTEGSSIPGLGTALFTGPDREKQVLGTRDETLVFTWASPEGFVVEKRYTFRPESYLITCDVRIRNTGSLVIADRLGFSLTSAVADRRAIGFEGPTALIDRDVERLKAKDIRKKGRYSGDIRWVALQDHYFATAVIPVSEEPSVMRVSMEDNQAYRLTYYTDTFQMGPGALVSKQVQFFAGPKSVTVLKEAGYGLQALVDFGWFDLLAQPCLWLLNKIYNVIPNYGVAIILLTVFIKLLFWPLGNKSYRAMNEMKKLQPLMMELREKYGHDKQKMNQEIMNLYRTYKVNPMSGCLPLLVQMPIFIALYRMLYEAIELRHAPFMGWIQDLSAPDRLFEFGFSIPFMQEPYGIPVLTIIMGATMFLQQKMAPPAGDPMQAKIMMFLPLIFTVIFINFPAGLVLYWLVNNILSIAQQYYIIRTSR